MRHALITTTLALTAALGSVGLLAQPAVAADGGGQSSYRIAQTSSNGGPNLFNLFQQVQKLQQQVRDLQGQVDTLKYRLKQSKQGQRDLYQNLDKRLSKLEGGGGDGGDGQVGNDEDASKADASSEVEAAYMDGFNKLKQGQYDESIASFKSFIEQNPDTSLTDNAWYWLGEAYYVQQDMSHSQKAFEKVVNRFADSSKVPASLYKIGLIQAGQDKQDNAKATFGRIIKQYPQSDSAGMAKKKLNSLGG